MSGTPPVWAPRRFWTAARVVEAAGGYAVTLDGRPLRTPERQPVVLTSRVLAEALAEEWDAQQGVIRPAAMPLTRAVNSALDRVTPRRAKVEAEIARFGETDLICYRAAAPAALVARQAAAWDPLLAWAAGSLGARLVTVAGVMFVPQPPAALAALSGALARFDAIELTALHELVALSGSLVIGLAAATGHAPAETLWHTAHVDEAWQAEQWGEDAEAKAAAALRRQAFLAAMRLIDMHRAG